MSRVEVQDLRVALPDGSDIVSELTFSIAEGEMVGLVGESGSGKTTAGLALLGHARPGSRIVGGSVKIDGDDLLTLKPDELRRLRGATVAYVAQDPSASLNPALKIGKQLGELIEVHEDGVSAAETRERVLQSLRDVKLPGDDPSFLDRYPHQLSGGQQQRICIAMAFLLRPKVVVLDEPTTGLDVVTQAHVLETVEQLSKASGVAALYVTHDLAVVANLASRMIVMYGGRIIEDGPREVIFGRAAHPYTRRLLECIPEIERPKPLVGIPGHPASPRHRPSGCAFHPRCAWKVDACLEDPPLVQLNGGSHSTRCFRATEVTAAPPVTAGAAHVVTAVSEAEPMMLEVRNVGSWYGSRQVVFDVSLELRKRQCLAIVGESGSGKSTLARTLIGLQKKWDGEIIVEGNVVKEHARDRSDTVRRRLQYIFQSPFNSLNPRRSVGESIGVPLDQFYDLNRKDRAARIGDALEQVGLRRATAEKYPSQLSGGERQRVGIARALVCEPAVLICDEITSALDVSVQASIVQLIANLQDETGLAMLFITHNLALARTIADGVVVMNQGRIVEAGGVESIFANAERDYTRELIDSTPSLTLTAG